MASVALSSADIRRLFALLDAELATSGTMGELYLVGGAVMCLAFNARESTRDIDALFKPSAEVRKAAARVAAREDIPDSWLNDAVKGFLSPRGEFDAFLELPNLRVFVARPEYMLAMKAVALRLGEAFSDLEDVRYLLRYLNITRADEAMAVITGYFDESQVRPKTRLALEELLGG